MSEVIWLFIGIGIGMFGIWNLFMRDFTRTRKRVDESVTDL